MGYRSVLQMYQAALQLCTSAKQNRNGIIVVMYVTMTVAILLAAYKKQKKLSGFKIPKRKFVQEFENVFLFTIVILGKGVAEVGKN